MWNQAVAQFAYGLGRMAFGNPTRSRSGNELSDVLEMMAQIPALALQRRKENGAMFYLHVGGASYGVLVLGAKGIIEISVVSKLCFPLGRVPPEIRLVGHLAAGDESSMKVSVLDMDDISAMQAVATGPASELSVQACVEILGNLAAAVEQCDRFAVERGFARR